MKSILILAGPNGAGKTTFAREFLPGEAGCPHFVNADLIAAGLSPFAPEAVQVQAGRLMLTRIEELVRADLSFGFETTLAGRSYAPMVRRWQSGQYRVRLIFLKLSSPELALGRVRQRVQEGGHDVPEPVIRRRFSAGWTNFLEVYRDLVDQWILYDNSGEEPVRLEEGRR